MITPIKNYVSNDFFSSKPTDPNSAIVQDTGTRISGTQCSFSPAIFFIPEETRSCENDSFATLKIA